MKLSKLFAFLVALLAASLTQAVPTFVVDTADHVIWDSGFIPQTNPGPSGFVEQDGVYWEMAVDYWPLTSIPSYVYVDHLPSDDGITLQAPLGMAFSSSGSYALPHGLGNFYSATAEWSNATQRGVDNVHVEIWRVAPPSTTVPDSGSSAFSLALGCATMIGLRRRLRC